MAVIAQRVPGQVVTFYSYKGGTGRTMALANVALLLAQREGGQVLVIDWDLEAPGLHRFLADHVHDALAGRDLDEPPGLIDLLERVALRAEAQDASGADVREIWAGVDFDEFILASDIPNLFMMKAGRFDAAYATRVNTFDWEGFHARAPAGFADFARRLTERFRYVLIDARTGLTDTGGICTTLLPERLVAVFTPNRQSLVGVVGAAERAIAYRKVTDDLRPLVVFPLASRVELSEDELRRRWRFGDEASGLVGFQRAFEALFERAYDLEGCDLTEYFDEVQLQHSTRFAYGESLAVLTEPGGDRLSLSRSYERFTRALADSDGPWTFGAKRAPHEEAARPQTPRREPPRAQAGRTRRALITGLSLPWLADLDTRNHRGLLAALCAGLATIAGAAVLSFMGRPESLTVYSSLPLQGPTRGRSFDMERGIRLALEQVGGRAGRFHVNYVALDDSTAEGRGWTAAAVSQNAAQAAQDEATAAYIGELNSGASAVSIPILSAAKVAQISPSNTAVGLTTSEPGSDQGEPDLYYVKGFRNYVRVVPRDTIQGRALATVMRGDGCSRVAVVHDRGLYGAGLATIVTRSTRRLRMRVVSIQQVQSRAGRQHRLLAAHMARRRADCVVISGDTRSGLVGIVTELARALPDARLYGTDGLADSSFTDVERGGLPVSVARRVWITVPALSARGADAAGRAFYAAFASEYPDDRNPDLYTIYAYEAMRLALDAIERSESGKREDIVKALFSTRDRNSALGRYSIDDNGDTTLNAYGLYAIRDGALRLVRRIEADG